MRIIGCLLGLVISVGCFSQKYAVSSIPAEVKKGANAIIRNSEQVYEILDASNATFSERRAITIYNEDVFGLAIFQESYDKLSKLKSIRVSYYDKDGDLLKKVRSGEIEDVNVTGSGSLYDDNRVKGFVPEEFEYPFTIEYSYVKEYQGLIGLQSFTPQFRNKLGVEKASFEVITPNSYAFRYKGMNGVQEPIVSTGSKNTFKWELENLEPQESEYRGISAADKSPKVLMGLSDFAMEGYTGNMSTWSGFGSWIAKLNEGRDQITDEVKAGIDELIAGINNDREKARLIYKYMQENTRYVSIQLGIGGFQPFDAMEVIKNGYGDCKALTNYTYSLLKYAGIKSNYMIIGAGPNQGDIETDFPSSQFNHVILGVPMEKDTVWLECTSQVAPFNFLGSFTDDRHGLWITEDGRGELVKTPEYSEEQSTQKRKTLVSIDAEGNAAVSMETVYRGLQYNSIYSIMDESSEDKRKYLLNAIDLPAFDLGDFSYQEDRSSEDPYLTERITLNARKYATKSGKRLFITPNLLNKYNAKPPKNEDRESPIVVGYGYVDMDTVSIQIPEGYRLEFAMDGYEVSSDFGSYQLDYNFNPETSELTYVRKLTIKAGEYPAEKYNDYRSFIRKIVKQDKSKIVLIGAT